MSHPPPPFDLWTSRLTDDLPWEAVHDFLSQRHQEGSRLEYRSGIDGSRQDRRVRVVETIGAMANSGGGLILVGVGDDGDNRPIDWPGVKPGSVTRQRVDNLCRAALNPFVEVDIGTATNPETQQHVVVIRVPSDVPNRPILIDGRGVLARVGEASVPATLDQLVAWMPLYEGRRNEAAGRLTLAVRGVPNMPAPILAMAVTPVWSWSRSRWDDATLDGIEATVDRVFADLKSAAVSETMIDFQVASSQGDLLRQVWVDAAGTVYRRYGFVAEPGELIDALRVAGEMRRTWVAAQAVVPIVLPGYFGPLLYRFAIGSAAVGFRSHRSMVTKLEQADRAPVRGKEGWMADREWSVEATAAEVISGTISAMLLAFGYRHVKEHVDELVAAAPTSASAENPPW